ncbi:peptidylprolyl isomerase [Rickettsiales bacterium LUAb2]
MKFLKFYSLALVMLLMFTISLKAEIKDFTQEDLNKTDIYYDPTAPNNSQVVIITDFGSIVIKLSRLSAPTSVANFISLVQEGYYNHTSFYKISDNYFIQAGDPQENGIGNAGLSFPNETKNEHFKEGTVALSNTNNDPTQTGSQFFITLVEAPWLDNRYNIIGEVVSGMPVIRSFSGKYSTDTYGIMQTPIPIKVYLLSDLIALFPNDNNKHIHPIEEQSALIQDILKQDKLNVAVKPTDEMSFDVVRPQVFTSPGYIDNIEGNYVETEKSTGLLDMLMRSRK